MKKIIYNEVTDEVITIIEENDVEYLKNRYDVTDEENTKLINDKGNIKVLKRRNNNVKC